MLRAIINRMKKNEKGFTLIELMVVVAIIGILAAGIIPQFMNASEKAKISAAKADIANLKTLLELVYAEDGSYPKDTSYPNEKGLGSLVDKGYLKSVPKDPWNEDYQYVSDGSRYTLTVKNGKLNP